MILAFSVYDLGVLVSCPLNPSPVGGHFILSSKSVMEPKNGCIDQLRLP